MGSLNFRLWLSCCGLCLISDLRNFNGLFRLLLSLNELLLLGLLNSALLSSAEEGNWSLVEDADSLFLDLLSQSDEVWDLNFDIWADDLSLVLVLLEVVEVRLRNIILSDDLLNRSVLEFFELLRAADTATKREDTTFARVSVRRRMSDAERAIDTVAVLERRSEGAVVLLVAREAEVVCAEASVKGDGAAELALPVNLDVTVLFASGLTCTDLFEEALLAHEVFFLCLVGLSIVHFLLAVNEATKVRILAAVAEVDRAALVGESLCLSVVVTADFCDTRILEDALLLSVLKGEFLALLLETDKRAKFTSDLARELLHLDLMFTAGTAHERPSDAQVGPAVLKKLSDAASVENVTARKLGARLSAEFTSVADATKLVSVNTALVELGSAIGIKARRAVLLILNSEALVTA